VAVFWYLDFSFLCTFVPGSEKSTDGTFVSVELSFPETFAPVERKVRELSHPWNFRFSGANVLSTFAPWNFRYLESTKVPSVDFSLPETKVQRNVKSNIRFLLPPTQEPQSPLSTFGPRPRCSHTSLSQSWHSYLRIIKRNFTYLDEHFIMLYKITRR